MARWHGLWMTPAQPADIEREINIERLATIGRHQALSSMAHSIVSLLLAVTLFRDLPAAVLAGLVAIQVAAAVQMSTWWRHRHGLRPRRATDRSMSRVVVWSVGWGVLWGAYSSTLLLLAPGAGRGPIAVAIVGMAAGGMNMLACLPMAAIAFLILSTAPPTLIALFSGEQMEVVFGVCLAIAAVFLALSGRRNYLSFLEHIRLRHGISRLADEAEAASRAKSRFLANMSHELRTPLNAIIGFAQMIHGQMKGPVADYYVDFSRAIEHSGRHLVEIINDILDLSKIQAGNRDLDDAVTTVAGVVDRAVLVTQPACAAAGMRLEVTLSPDLPQIHVDGRRLSQVIINLLSNAVKFSAAGSVIKLDASLDEPRPTGGRPVVIQISDTGIGIPADELSEVLKPFVQSREAERRQTPGTGLGLPLADEIMRLHGGSLTLTSVVGEGTSVTLRLPPERTFAAIQGPRISREIAS